MRRSTTRTVSSLACVALALLVTGCGSKDTGSQDTASGGEAKAGSPGGTVTLKVERINIYSDAAVALGVDQGFFKAEGLNLDLQTVPNPPAGIAAVQGGQADVVYTPSIPFLNAVSQGVPLIAVAPADGYPVKAASQADPTKVDDTGLYVAKNAKVTSPKDLAGKAVAVPARKAQLEVTISKAVADAGGDPAKVQWIVLDFPSAVQALDAGRVAAAGLVSPFTNQAKSKGNTLIASPGVNFFREGAVGLWVTSAKTKDQKADAMKAFQRAVAKSNAYANSHLDAALAKAAELTKVDASVVKSGATPFWPSTISQADIDRAADNLVTLGFLPKRPDTSKLIAASS